MAAALLTKSTRGCLWAAGIKALLGSSAPTGNGVACSENNQVHASALCRRSWSFPSSPAQPQTLEEMVSNFVKLFPPKALQSGVSHAMKDGVHAFGGEARGWKYAIGG
jgi:hypothetical protein